MKLQINENLPVIYGGIVVDKAEVKSYVQIQNADGSKSEMHQLILNSGTELLYPTQTQTNSTIKYAGDAIHLSNISNASIFISQDDQHVHLKGDSNHVNTRNDRFTNIDIYGDDNTLIYDSCDKYRMKMPDTGKFKSRQ